MSKRTANNINSKYIIKTKKRYNNNFFFADKKYSENNKFKKIPFIFSKKGNNNNKVKRKRFPFGYENEQNYFNNNKNIKVYFFKNQINNLLLFIFLIFSNLLKEYSLTLLGIHSSNITIKIKESGMQKIFFEGSACYSTRPKFDFPDAVIINDEKLINISAKYNFERENNTIQLIWNESRDNWGCLFKNCDKITEIDFSQFDFSKGINGNMMFSGCKSLTSLNINDFGKVKIKDSGSFFVGLESLTS